MATVSPTIEQACARRDLELQVAELQAAFARLGRIDTTTWQPTVTQNGGAIALTRNWADFQVVGGWCHFHSSVTLTAASTGTGFILFGGIPDGLPSPLRSSNSYVLGHYRIITSADNEAGEFRFSGALDLVPLVSATGVDYSAQLSNGAVISVGGSYPVA